MRIGEPKMPDAKQNTFETEVEDFKKKLVSIMEEYTEQLFEGDEPVNEVREKYREEILIPTIVEALIGKTADEKELMRQAGSEACYGYGNEFNRVFSAAERQLESEDE